MGKQWKQTDIIFLGSKITVDCDFRHETKRLLLLGRKALTNLDSIIKSRDITLATKVCLVKALVFLLVMYGCESWTIKKVEHWRTDAFELSCWRRLLRVPWTARRSNKSILKEIKTLNIHWKDWCWSWISYILATWWEEPIHWKRPWWWGRLKAGGEGGNRGRDGWMALLTQWTWFWARRMLKDREFWHVAVHGVANSWTWLSDWTTTRDRKQINCCQWWERGMGIHFVVIKMFWN